MMVDQIRKIDPSSVISVCAAGRATLYMTTLATMMGLHIRVGVEDTPWKYPNSNDRLSGNLEMFSMARDLAGLLGRKPGDATVPHTFHQAFLGHALQERDGRGLRYAGDLT